MSHQDKASAPTKENQTTEFRDHSTLEVIDPHVHYWCVNTHTWLRGSLADDATKPLKRFAPVAKPFTPTDHIQSLLPRYKLVGAVYVQANMHIDRSAVEEAAFCEGIRFTGHRMGFTCYAPLHKPDEAKKVLDDLKRYEGFRGIRFMLDYNEDRPELCQTDSGGYMNDANFLQGMSLLEKERGLVFELQLCQIQLEAASEFVAKFPKLTFILNHAGFPLRGQFDEWHKGILALATCPNVCVKIGGLGCYDETNWSQTEIDTYVRATIDAFGVDRSMFASNLPVDLIDIPNPTLRYDSFLQAVNGIYPPSDIQKLFHDNALNYYKI
mmetsp:Transcript_12859/g.19272  ORF Transcript_12859/g.19272 Transcript_12859/m.19272 type:complete len:325 (-) Transcript_12859:856-1830(-)